MQPNDSPATGVDIQNVDVFLNVPFDEQFTPLFVAYVGGLVTLGLEPRASLEIPGGASRLDRIVDLISRCSQSVHDLSRVEMSVEEPTAPRFNMPFELGLAVGYHRRRGADHTWFVFEAHERRLKKSLSDLSGSDAYIHNGTPQGVLSELLNAFVRSPRQPAMQQIVTVNEVLQRSLHQILRKAGADTPFRARAFKELLAAARNVANAVVGP